jgi:hypothetical protein
MAEGYIAGGSWGGPVEFNPTGFVSSKDLAGALGQLGKIGQQTADKDPGFLSPTSAAPGQPMRRASLDQLVQLLNKQRDELYTSSAGGQAQPYAVPRTVGLLGF